MDQKAQRAAEHNDCANRCNLMQIARNDRAKDFAAELEFEAQSQRACKIKANIECFFRKIQYKIPSSAKENDDDAHCLKQMNACCDYGMKQKFKQVIYSSVFGQYAQK